MVLGRVYVLGLLGFRVWGLETSGLRDFRDYSLVLRREWGNGSLSS